MPRTRDTAPSAVEKGWVDLICLCEAEGEGRLFRSGMTDLGRTPVVREKVGEPEVRGFGRWQIP